MKLTLDPSPEPGLRPEPGAASIAAYCGCSVARHTFLKTNLRKLKKAYLHRLLRRKDRRAIEKMVRETRPLVHYPTYGFDFYNLDEVRAASRRDEVDCRALLDNNVISRLLSLINENGPVQRQELEAETRRVCGIAAYLIYSGIEIVPAVAHYERRRSFGSAEKIEDDFRLHSIDHLDPQVLADLYAGRTATIPRESYRQAQSMVDESSIPREYDEVEQPGVKLSYTHLLYAWQLNKTEPNASRRLEKYLAWSYEQSLSSKPLALFTALLLSDNRPPKMIKRANSADAEVVLQGARNAAWDLFYLGNIDLLTSEHQGKLCWCFVTRDELLRDIGSRIFSMRSDEDFPRFIDLYFDKEGQDMLQESRRAIATRENFEEHRSQVVASIDDSVQELECFVRRTLCATERYVAADA